MKMPENRHYYSLVTKSRFYVPKQNSGEGRGSLRPGDLGEEGVDHPPDQTGGSLHPGLRGDRRPCYRIRGELGLMLKSWSKHVGVGQL